MNIIDVSVVIVTYNQEKYIGEAIESVVNQETDYTMEVLVSDDCSTDRTWEIVKSYADRYDCIKPVRREKNLGFIQNYYDTMQRCSGRYIMDCAGDDYWLQGKVQSQIEYMDNNPSVGLYAGQSRIVFEDGKIKTTHDTWCSFYDLLGGKRINCCAICIRKSMYDEYYSLVKPNKKKWLMEDYPVFLWFSKNSQMFVSDEIMSVYRYISESVSHNNDMEKNLAFNQNAYNVADYFCKTDEERELAYRAYIHAEAECYWLYGEMQKYRTCYRKHIKQFGRVKDYIKYVLAFLPGMGLALRSLYCRK